MAAVVDAEKPLVKATYRLEGDWLLPLVSYEIISSALEGARVTNYPNLNAIMNQFSAGNQQVQQQLAAYVHAAVRPGLDYLNNVLSNTLKHAIDIFKVVRFFNPRKVVQM